jgi:hypothetical protein
MAIWGLTKDIMGAGLHEELNTLISKKMNVVGWNYPPPHWMKLNVNGCMGGDYRARVGLVFGLSQDYFGI